MTGFGRARVEEGTAVAVVEARAVNHRFLDVRLRLPPALQDHASRIEEPARKRLVRGRIELSARLESRGGEVALQRDRAESAYRALVELRDALAPSEPVPLSLLSAVPDLFAQSTDRDEEHVARAVGRAAAEACDALIAMRETEGEQLARDMGERLQRVRELAATIRPRVPAVVEEYRERLTARVERLLSGTEVQLDPTRIAHEVALIADRADIEEELTRLNSHAEQLESLLTVEGPVGRKTEFLLQELGREVNTIGSKVGDVEITRHVLELKSEIERMREQVQNVL
jgi:uncharacterized protein (TIGR00255 family)